MNLSMRNMARTKCAAIRLRIIAPVMICLSFVGLLWLAAGAHAQTSPASEIFQARLSPVPINISMMATIAGTGALSATLSGRTLTIHGTFEGLKSPATTAQIHRAPKGIPGAIVPNTDLRVTKAVKGEIGGTLELTPEQVADLRNGMWYVQIQSEGAPDGNSWGWLLK